jgi:heat shock protein HtpX
LNRSVDLVATLRLGAMIAVIAFPLALAGAIVAGLHGAIVGVSLGVVLFTAAYAVAGQVIVRIFDAEYADGTMYQDVIEIVERLSLKAGIVPPRVAVSRLGTPNAFAAPTPKGGVLGVTEPLLSILTPAELEAVLAHELSHLRRPARSLATTAAMFAAIPGAISMRLGCVNYYDVRFRRSRRLSSSERRNQVFGFWLALPAALVVRLAASRSVEFEADTGAVELCGGSDHLVSALRKINSLAGRLVSPVNPALAHLLVVHPFSQTPLSRMFDAHPPMEQRIARLLQPDPLQR